MTDQLSQYENNVPASAENAGAGAPAYGADGASGARVPESPAGATAGGAAGAPAAAGGAQVQPAPAGGFVNPVARQAAEGAASAGVPAAAPARAGEPAAAPAPAGPVAAEAPAPAGTPAVAAAPATAEAPAVAAAPASAKGAWVPPASQATAAVGGADGVAAPPKKRGWIVALVAVIVLGLVAMVGVVSCSAAIGGLTSYATVSESATVGDSIGVIEIDSTIQYDGTVCSPEGFKEQLDIAAENPDIKAIVLHVNSGGGTATAGEEMTAYLQEFKEKTGKPVVVSSASMNASAAYEISSQADYIYTCKSTAIGSIGTAMQITDYSDLLEKLGVKIEDIVSSSSKDSSYGTRALTAEERKEYQHQVDQINQMFISYVAQGRGMTTAQVNKLATGMSFTGVDAVENGLADAIGTFTDAQNKAAELAGIGSSFDVVYLDQSTSDFQSVLDALQSSDVSLSDVMEYLEENSNDKTLR